MTSTLDSSAKPPSFQDFKEATGKFPEMFHEGALGKVVASTSKLQLGSKAHAPRRKLKPGPGAKSIHVIDGAISGAFPRIPNKYFLISQLHSVQRFQLGGEFHRVKSVLVALD